MEPSRVNQTPSDSSTGWRQSGGVAVFPRKLGLAVKEAVELWKGDLREKSLLVRGARLREVPLSPFAQEVS